MTSWIQAVVWEILWSPNSPKKQMHEKYNNDVCGGEDAKMPDQGDNDPCRKICKRKAHVP